MTYLFSANTSVTNEVEVKNDVGNPIRVTSTNTNLDAFGRMQVTTPFTLGDYKHLYGIDPNFIEYYPNGGNVVFKANQACARLHSNNSSNSFVVHQSKFYHHYMPGKAQSIFSSFNFYQPMANVTKRTGYFDDNNGIFLEQTGDGTLNLVIRNYVTGAATERRVPQSEWNIDRCDGAGNSQFYVDVTKTQLLSIDFQWLGVGRVRCGFVHDGELVHAHQFLNSNVLAEVYMSTPNLPIRCEIRNTGTTNGGFFDQICSTVMSEGGYVESGQDWATSTPSLVTVTSGATKPIIAIRLTNTFKGYSNRMIVRMGNLSMFSSGENIRWRLVKLPSNAYITANTLAWTNVNANSGIQFNSDITSFTDGEEMDNGFVGASTQGSQKAGGAPGSNIPSSAKKNYIVQNYDSTDSEIFLVETKNLGSQSTDVGVGLQWREIY